MKHFSYRILSIFCVAFLLVASSSASAQFDRYFKDATFRFDYYHTGSKGEERISEDKMIEEGAWPGSLTNLIDTLNLGEYFFTITDIASNRIIFSRGYSSLFFEWQTTDEALAGVYRTFNESLRFPFPLNKFQLTILRRNKQMIFNEIFSTVVDPNGGEIHREKKHVGTQVMNIFTNGDSHAKVDIVILGDGYSKSDMPKFRADARHFTDVLFGTEPFKSRKKDFNVRAVEVESRESGIDQPDQNVWVDNALGTTYDSFGSARYVLTDDNKDVRDYAAVAPYDFLFILVNANRYGGGGIFQLYATCFATGETPATAWQTDYVFVHEFGHSFAGLGDEYYTSSTAYNDFYPKGVEPWEPNIAANIERGSLKWKAFVDSTTSLPTPWDKAAYDSLEIERGKLRRDEEGYAEKREAILDKERSILDDKRFKGIVGAFEGSGYASTGLYRPSLDCRMFSLSLTDFDPVCTNAINRMIDFYTK
ncbi:MAG TPA: M64 family metallopeptidase [Bacteroidota bacterium]|nr:M64 family metallopeptidase [Bacteroidota bacterium]